MKSYILILLLLSGIISGCATTCEPIVKVEVYTPPKVTMPVRPVLASAGGDVNTVTKNAEKDLIDLESYATQLENIISKVFKIEK